MPTANQRISEYVLQEKLGQGAFGEVWRGTHHVWVDQQVAIKIPTDRQYVANLQREGSVIHGLRHPNIVRALGFDPFADPPYLIMEYVPGTSLRPLISDRRLTVPQAVAVMRQVLGGLEHAHGQGLVHRDVKPENILVHERAFAEGFELEGAVKVTDFGLGRAANTTTAAASIALTASLNDPGARALAGTLDYMAPEQRGGEEVDGRADLYACGVVLYELLTGERPAGMELPSDLNPQVPAWLDEVFRRAFARLEKRFTTAGEFLAALQPGPPPLPHSRAAGGIDSAVPQGHQRCPQCRRVVEQDDQFCMHCGTQLAASIRRCGRCGAYPDRSDQYCVFCGETLAAMVG